MNSDHHVTTPLYNTNTFLRMHHIVEQYISHTYVLKCTYSIVTTN